MTYEKVWAEAQALHAKYNSMPIVCGRQVTLVREQVAAEIAEILDNNDWDKFARRLLHFVRREINDMVVDKWGYELGRRSAERGGGNE